MACTCGPGQECQPLKPGCWGYEPTSQQPQTTKSRAVYWRCFHCGETFTRAQKRWAREHFGGDELETPVCQMRVPGESSLLTALRNAQEELARYRAEDTDLMRAIWAMQSDHADALRREEEVGYERGLRDARKEQAA